MTPHYGKYENRLVIYYAGDPVLIAQKDRDLKDLADRCSSGQLVLPVTPPVTIRNQRWLLKLASEALAMAAECWRD